MAKKSKAKTKPKLVGFLPCFSDYRHDLYPVEKFYDKKSYFLKVKVLIDALMDSPDTLTISGKIGGKKIAPIRPDETSPDYKTIIAQCKVDGETYPYSLFRIDYGDCPFRVVFGLQNSPIRKAPIFIVDTEHATCSDKSKKAPRGGRG